MMQGACRNTPGKSPLSRKNITHDSFTAFKEKLTHGRSDAPRPGPFVCTQVPENRKQHQPHSVPYLLHMNRPPSCTLLLLPSPSPSASHVTGNVLKPPQKESRKSRAEGREAGRGEPHH